MLIKKFLIMAMSVTPLLTSFSPVFAAEFNEVELRRQNVLYYDTTEQGNVCTTGTCSTLVGSNDKEKAYNYFQSKGLTPDQSAGIVGNLVAESNVNPKSKQGGNGTLTISNASEIRENVGYGIAQWTSPGRQAAWKQFAEDNNKDQLDLCLQLDFLWHELEAQPEFYGLIELKKATSLRQATWVFLSYFEKPATIINSNSYRKSVVPSSGSGLQELEDRMPLAEGIRSSTSSSSGSGGICEGGTEKPTFEANPNITRDGSPAGEHQESNCTESRTYTPGAQALSDYVVERWSPPVTSVGGYSCRAIVGGTRTSIHGVGRALDIMIDAEGEGLLLGNKIRNYLINNAEALGIQRVIWNRKTWTPARDGWNIYTGLNPHTDHLHVEINLEASVKEDLI